MTEKFAHALPLKREDYLPIARELNMVVQADRQCLRALLARVHERRSRSQPLRIHMLTCLDTVLDPTFAPWLAAELKSNAVSGSTFVLDFEAQELHARLAQAQPLLESLQRLGLRLGVELRSNDPGKARELLHAESINVVKFMRPDDSDAEAAWNQHASLFKEARSLGKTVLASGVKHVKELPILLRLGTHYVQSDALAAWSSEWNFDFAAIA
jgi:EAL domain-containing protein (putative c-di-GMP-specific phosphodiesterase class I)